MFLALIAAVALSPVEAETRQILDEILRVDTSHGNETAVCYKEFPLGSAWTPYPQGPAPSPTTGCFRKSALVAWARSG
jgi:hypothetical protein